MLNQNLHTGGSDFFAILASHSRWSHPPLLTIVKRIVTTRNNPLATFKCFYRSYTKRIIVMNLPNLPVRLANRTISMVKTRALDLKF